MPALFCKLFAGLANTNKPAIFLLSDFSSLSTHSPFLRLLPENLGRMLQELSSFSPVLSGYNGSAADKLAGRSALLVPCAVL